MKKSKTISSLTNSSNISESNINYFIALIKKCRYDILIKNKNRVFSKEFKLHTINKVLVNLGSIRPVTIDIILISDSTLYN